MTQVLTVVTQDIGVFYFHFARKSSLMTRNVIRGDRILDEVEFKEWSAWRQTTKETKVKSGALYPYLNLALGRDTSWLQPTAWY